ncbi:MAG: hypothetical protein ABJF01_03840 [bacterium]
MTSVSYFRRTGAPRTSTTLLAGSFAVAAVFAASCASSGASSTGMTSMNGGGGGAVDMSTAAPSPDRRVGLRAGTTSLWSKDTTRRVIVDRAAETAWNIRLLANRPASEPFTGITNSDLAFIGNYAIQGSYDGYQVWDISNSSNPTLKTAYLCPASQSDVSVYKNLLFVSAEGQTGRKDCGGQGVPDSVSAIRVRGVRLFDITDITKPKYITDVQTCRGSHTHTVLVDPNDKDNVYVYISGSSGVRPEAELAGCSDLAPGSGANSAVFRIEVIKVPLAHPEQAKVVSGPRIFQDLVAPPRANVRVVQDSVEQATARAARIAADIAAGRTPDTSRGRGGPGGVRAGPTQCHDITVYPALGLAGGACGGYGLLLDIKDPANPKRIAAVADSNFSFWHSATFSNDGSKMLFTDEWGGGSAPRCRASDKYEWGADAIFSVTNNQLTFKGYYKMPAAQTSTENCVAHNGSLIPIPGREVMVQGWYQGGISVFDWTDAGKPKEIAYFDRGPLDANRLVSGGSWSVYWYNGALVSSEIARGLDVFELMPSGFISQNELDAAKTVHFDYLNAQGQPKLVWPASFSLSRAYLDQLSRNNGLSAEKIAATRLALTAAEKLSGQPRKDALTALATQLHTDAAAASDAPRSHKLAFSVGDLANASR